ncbi:hypothetical protein [Arthrobacter sp. NA-172]|uniref:hypothetical protein n=1 Tax=Arthrobacter sp. NA-172 TaxID=3367524 RepID=UPI00375509A0
MLNTADSYTALRTTAGVYHRAGEVMRLTGLHRGRLLTWMLAKQSEFAEPGTVLESLVLDDEGAVDGVALVVFDDESIIVVSDCATPLLHVATSAIDALQLVDTHAQQEEDFGYAIAVEGPVSWKVGDGLTDEDMSEILLNEWRRGSLDGKECILIRIGTTAEYGYVVLTSSAAGPSSMKELTARAREVDGGEIDPLVLRRAQAEVNHPVLPVQALGLSIFEAGIQWMATPNRDDEYRGRNAIRLLPPTRRIVAASTAGEDFPLEGQEVTDEGTPIGVVKVSTPRAGQDTGFGLLLLDIPYCVPGLTLTAGGQTVRTLARPAVDPVSWTQQIGV